MREDAILALEHVVVLVEGVPVLHVVVGPVRSGQVAVLSDAKLSVANLFISQPGHNDLRVPVSVTSDDVVVH